MIIFQQLAQNSRFTNYLKKNIVLFVLFLIGCYPDWHI